MSQFFLFFFTHNVYCTCTVYIRISHFFTYFSPSVLYIACSEAYPSSGEQQYACVTGCNATTIDSLFPDRELIYSSDKPSGNDSNSDAALFDQAADLMDYVFNTFFSSFSLTSDLDRLTEHAQQMSQLLPPVKSSMITYVIQDVSVCVCV